MVLANVGIKFIAIIDKSEVGILLKMINKYNGHDT